LLDQGSVAQPNAAPEFSGAALVGKSHLYPTKWSGHVDVRTEDSLVTALMEFFKDNPTWE
jgi:hypothetical protein